MERLHAKKTMLTKNVRSLLMFYPIKYGKIRGFLGELRLAFQFLVYFNNPLFPEEPCFSGNGQHIRFLDFSYFLDKISFVFLAKLFNYFLIELFKKVYMDTNMIKINITNLMLS